MELPLTGLLWPKQLCFPHCVPTNVSAPAGFLSLLREPAKANAILEFQNRDGVSRHTLSATYGIQAAWAEDFFWYFPISVTPVISILYRLLMTAP